ncbi:MAG TPA: DsbA family protein [Caulobacteraceae bacterium]|jgi:protein-disulfide isomerase
MRLATALAAALLLSAGCSRAAEPAPAVDKAFGDKVRAYLLAHPEVLEEASAKLQEKKKADAEAQSARALDQNRQALERDPRDYVANPNGRITVSEFYDYRCPYCITMAPRVVELIAKNPDVRFVFKELPIFGAASDRAAHAALAVRRAGGDYVGVHRDFMAAKPLDNAAIDRVLRAHRFDPAQLDAEAAKVQSDKHLADTRELAGKLNIEGTPAFVVGDTMVMGADWDLLQAAITGARAQAR